MKGQRILAIDHGSKRIGFALSDELGWTAQPLETFYRRNPEADIRHIQELVRGHEVGLVLVGLPLRLDGESGPAAKLVEEFIQLLEPALSVPVVTWDERMTTCAAEDLLIAADVGRRKRKGIVDRIAAAILHHRLVVRQKTRDRRLEHCLRLALGQTTTSPDSRGNSGAE